LGFFIAILAGSITNLFLPILGYQQYGKFGPFATIIFIAFTTYAIVKHQLMEIRVVVANVLVFIIGIILFAQIFISGDLPSMVLRAVLFVFYAYFGYLLVKSVSKEIEQRKQLEELSLRLELSLELADLKQIIQEIVEHFKVNASQKGLFLKDEVSSQPGPRSVVDKDRLKEVLQNLITNAIKFTDKGGVNGGIEGEAGSKIGSRSKKTSLV
jgi:Ca2+/Na+ antiporter